jgi:hypothetical protein
MWRRRAAGRTTLTARPSHTIEARGTLRLSIVAFTINQLATTNWTTLNIATKNMKLTLDNSAVVAWLSVCSPIVHFLAVADALALNAFD